MNLTRTPPALRGTRASRFLRHRPQLGAPSTSPYVLSVEFDAEGGTWSAVGGGDTLADAIAFTRESLPHGRDWRVVGWNDLYGD